MGGQFYGYVTGTANLSCEAEAEPPPSFRWLDAENNPVQAGTVVNMQYKVGAVQYHRQHAVRTGQSHLCTYVAHTTCLTIKEDENDH